MAGTRSIFVALNLRDRFTRPIQRTAAETRRFEREVKRIQNNIKKYTSNLVTSFKNMATKIMKAAGSFSLKAMEKAFSGLKKTALAAFSGITAGLTAGILEGMDYEKYRVQLETATKDTEKATKLMKNAIDFANKTPFETGQVIEATSLFESMGLSAEKWLSITADMAGATSKDLIQAVEAVIDAVSSGEYERLKEFGIKKDSLAGFNAGGELVDQNAMIDSLMGMMEDRFEGGAEALSKTTSGMWSTVTGVFKNSMAKIVGVMDDGTIRAGSVLDRFKKYVKKAADTLLKWQQDGTIDKIATKFETGMSTAIKWIKELKSMIEQTIIKLSPLIQNAVEIVKLAFIKLKPIIIEVLKAAKDKIKELIEWSVDLSEKVKSFIQDGGITELIDNLKIIGPIILGIYAAQKLWNLGIKAYALWTQRAIIAQAILNIISGAWKTLIISNPWGLLFTALIVILLLVIANFDKVKAACLAFGKAWVEFWENVGAKLHEKLESMKTAWVEFWENVGAKLHQKVEEMKTAWVEFWENVGAKLHEKVEEMKLGFNNFWDGLKEGVKDFANFFVEKINWCIDKLNGLLSFKMPNFLGGAEIGFNIPTIPEFATGTSYHRGGLARINEGGRGEIINLPNGSQVIPHDVSKKSISNNSSINIPITIQGNVYGDNDLVNRVGSMIAQRVTLAIGNV